MAKLGKSKVVAQRLWRPDFRNIESLPDTKAIRTDFLVNVVGIVIAAACLAWFGYREAELRGLAKVVNDLETQVANATDSDRKYLDLNKKFVQDSEIATEVIAFDSEPVSFHSFLSQIGGIMQEGMVLTNLTLAHLTTSVDNSGLAPFQIELIGRVLENTPESPAQMLDKFQKDLRELQALTGKSIEIDMSRFNRNNELGHFDFTLLIKIKVNKAPAL